ncbi:MAG: hypothetical protein CH6_1733 [Candidatus Kapaibacterium sp.]|nr:MAG: hypothetical protein CH6_1733 [Candidatus Kapabacteria bacterium]
MKRRSSFVLFAALFFIIYFNFSFAYSNDTTNLKLFFPILDSKIGGAYVGSIESCWLRYNDKTNNVLSFNPLSLGFSFLNNHFLNLGFYFNVFNLGQAKAENLQIFEASYSYNIFSNANSIFSVKLSDKYYSGFLNENKIKENTMNLNLLFVHKIWKLGGDGVRVFARTGLGYLFSEQQMAPHLFLGVSLERGITLSVDVLSFFTKYKTNTYLINSSLLR